MAPDVSPATAQPYVVLKYFVINALDNSNKCDGILFILRVNVRRGRKMSSIVYGTLSRQSIAANSVSFFVIFGESTIMLFIYIVGIFVQRNLVMVVVIVSLIFWIPAALLVNYIVSRHSFCVNLNSNDPLHATRRFFSQDQKRDEEHQQQLNIMDTIIGNQFDYVRDGKWSAL